MQEEGRRELLKRDVIHVAVHEDEDKVLDAVYKPDCAVQHGSLVLVNGLGGERNVIDDVSSRDLHCSRCSGKTQIVS